MPALCQVQLASIEPQTIHRLLDCRHTSSKQSTHPASHPPLPTVGSDIYLSWTEEREGDMRGWQLGLDRGEEGGEV